MSAHALGAAMMDRSDFEIDALEAAESASACGAYRTEFYPTYDYKAVAEEERRKPK
jgi:hypothetical protein